MEEMAENTGAKRDLHIQLLGGFSVWIAGEAIPDGQWKSRRARSLVKLLALAPGHRLHRDQVIDALWPDADLSAAANNFHQTLYAARKILEPSDGFSLALEEGFLSLTAGEGQPLTVDVEQFEAAAAQAKEGRDPDKIESALAFYQGDLLPEDLYEEGTIQRREALRQVHLNLLLELARLQEDRQAYPAAIATLLKLLEVDRAHESAHVSLMRLYALSGQRQQALRQYQTLCEALQAELEAAPSEQSTRLYEAIQAGQFAPAPSPPPPPPTNRPVHNLPVQLTSFIGREKQIGEVVDLLRNHRLVTLTGSGGTGKSRLALQVAEGLLETFPDGAWLVELAPLVDPQGVAQAVAAALGLQKHGEGSYQTILLNYLGDKRLLVVLDNCEHLLEACASLAHELLRHCPSVTILATSREALGSAGETAYRVPSLSAPDPAALSPEELARGEAVRLFAERAAAIRPGFILTSENLPTAARICHRLDGIPLAIELAAARVGALSLEQIAAYLNDRFRLLTGGSRTALPRQRTLRASIDWSYSLLAEAEKRLLQRLSVFSGGWTLPAAQQVCALDGAAPWEVLDGLASLVNKSLVNAEHRPGSETRYRMLETVRQYAQERLEDAGGAARVRDAHRDYYLALAEEYEMRLKTPRIGEALDRLDLELDNLRAALNWALGMKNRTGARQAARIVCSLTYFWDARALLFEALGWLEHALPLLSEGDPAGAELRARACLTIGYLYDSQIDQVKARLNTEESIRLYRRLGDPRGLALALALYYYIVFTFIEQFPSDKSHFMKNAPAIKEESLSIASELIKSNHPVDRWTAAQVYLWIGYGEEAHYQYDLSLPLAQQARTIFTELGDRQGEIDAVTIILNNMTIMTCRAIIAGNLRQDPDQILIETALSLARSLKLNRSLVRIYASLGILPYYTGNYEQMVNYFEELRQLNLQVGDVYASPWPNRMSGLGRLRLGDIPAARRCLQEALERSIQLNDPNGVLGALIHLAGTAAATQDVHRAARLLGYVERQYEGFFKEKDPWDGIEFERYTAQTKAALDEAEFSTLWQQGREMTMDEALAAVNKISV